FSKCGRTLPSPKTKVAGLPLTKVESTTSPLASCMEKCMVILQLGPMGNLDCSLDVSTFFTFTLDILDTTLAKFRMRLMLPNVFPVMPATCAFFMCRCKNGNLQT